MPTKNNIPRRKRITKQARLNSAVEWIKRYKGKNIIKGYAKWFGVDEASAVSELKNVGLVISDELSKKIIESHELKIRKRNKIHEATMTADSNLTVSDPNFAFIAGYTSNGLPYGLTHDEMEQFKLENTD